MPNKKDGSPQNTPEYHNRSYKNNNIHAETFRFTGLYPGEIEIRIVEILNRVDFLEDKMIAVEMIRYTDPDREKLFIETQDELRLEKVRLRNAEKAFQEAIKIFPYLATSEE